MDQLIIEGKAGITPGHIQQVLEKLGRGFTQGILDVDSPTEVKYQLKQNVPADQALIGGSR